MLSALMSLPAPAAPPGFPGASSLRVEAPAGMSLVQGYCGRQNFVCRRRFDKGRRYRDCMAERGCAVSRGGRNGGNRCEARTRFCGRRFEPGSRRFNGCVRRGGC